MLSVQTVLNLWLEDIDTPLLVDENNAAIILM